MIAAETIEFLRAHAKTDLFPQGGVAVAIAHRNEALRPLADDESMVIESALPKRRSDFRLGRHCAHLALAKLGVRAASVPVGPDRAPVWPKGVCGTLSHSHGLGIAAIARDDLYPGIGIDIEAVRNGFGANDWPAIFTRSEIDELSALPPTIGARRAHIWFSAKESAFKAIHGAVGTTCPLRTICLDRMGDHVRSASQMNLGTHCGIGAAIGRNFVISSAWIVHRSTDAAYSPDGFKHAS